ncbi:MAG: glycosyltransferase family 39 protein [Cyanobacteria bacterium P01_A01_bin.114]
MRTDRFLYLVLTVVLIALLYNLNSWPLLEGTEAQYAEISREMLRSGDYLRPRLLWIDTYDHPPLTYWLTALGMRLWGINPFGARFFGQVALVVQAGLVYHIAIRLLGSRQVALFAGLIYPTLPLVLLGSRQLSPAIFLNVFELGAVYSALIYHLEKRWLALYGLALCLGLGFLTSGFQIFVLPGAFTLYLLLFGQGTRQIHLKHAFFAGLLFLLVGGFWFIYLASQHDNFLSYFWQTYWYQPIARPTLLSTRWWQFPLALMAGSLPWIGILITSLLRRNFGLWDNPIIVQMALFWLLLPSVALALSDRSIFSLLPVFAGFAIILGYISHLFSGIEMRRYGVLFLQLYLLAGALAFSVPLFSQLLGERLHLSWPMAITALGMIGLNGLLFTLIKAGVRFRLVAMALVSSLLLLIYSGYFLSVNPFWVKTTQPLAQIIRTRQLQDLPVLVYNETLPSLAFNLDRDLITINGGDINPDVRFQTRSAWRDHWVQMDEIDSARYLRRQISSPSVLIVSGKLPLRLSWMQTNYTRSEQVGRWTLFYRPG